MTGFKYVLLDVSESVATITLNRPKRGNAITGEMGQEIVAALARCREDSSVFSVVLTGAGKYFCTGMDLGQGNQAKLQEELESGVAAQRSLEMFSALREFPKPLIVRMNGPAFGGGCGLVFVGDIRIARKESFICFSEVRRGIVPALISAFIVQQMGEFLSLQYMTTGMRFPVEEMMERGLLTAVVADEAALDERVALYCTELKKCAPQAVQATKANIRHCAEHLHADNLLHVQQTFQRFIHSAEAMHGIGAFARKQDPDWVSYAAAHGAQARL